MSEDLGPSPKEMGVESEPNIEAKSLPELVLATEKARQLANPEAGRLHGHPIDELKTILDRAVTEVPVAPFPAELDPAHGAQAAKQLLGYLAEHPSEFNNAMASGEQWLGLDGVLENIPDEQIVNREAVITAEQLQTFINRIASDERYRIPSHLVINKFNLPNAAARVDRVHLFVSLPGDEQGQRQIAVATLDLKELGIDLDDEKAPTLVIPYDRFVRPGSPEEAPLTPISPPSPTEIAAVHAEISPEEQRLLADLLVACQGTFTEEEIASFEAVNGIDEALTYATTLLKEHGITEPEEFLRQRGIIV